MLQYFNYRNYSHLCGAVNLEWNIKVNKTYDCSERVISLKNPWHKILLHARQQRPRSHSSIKTGQCLYSPLLKLEIFTTIQKLHSKSDADGCEPRKFNIGKACVYINPIQKVVHKNVCREISNDDRFIECHCLNNHKSQQPLSNKLTKSCIDFFNLLPRSVRPFI